MKLKGKLISTLALVAAIGMGSLGVVNADDSSTVVTDAKESTTIECPQDGTGTGPKDGTGVGAQNKQGQKNGQGNGQGKGQGQHKGEGRQGRGGIFMKSVEELQQSGVLSEDDVKNIQDYHVKNREERQKRMYNETCTKIDEMVEQKIITAEQGQKLKEAVENNMNSVQEQQ